MQPQPGPGAVRLVAENVPDHDCDRPDCGDDGDTRAPTAVLRPPDYAAVVAELNAFGVAGLSASNGLSEDENRALFATASVDATVSLLMRGLSRITPGRTSPGQGG
jgi:hypothetical protein